MSNASESSSDEFENEWEGSNGSEEEESSTEEKTIAIVEKVSARLNGLKEASASVKLRDKTKENLHMLHKYLDSRSKIDDRIHQVDEFQRIATFPLVTDSGGIETKSDDPLEFKSDFQQQLAEGKPVITLDERHIVARIAKPIYRQTLENIVDQVYSFCGCNKDDIQILGVPLKGSERAQEKADDDYSKRKPGPGVSWLYDIVRASIIFSTTEQIARCLEAIRDDPSIRVVKAKNRFEKPTLTGYRDFNLCIQIDIPGYRFRHICELQIHHKAIQVLQTELKTTTSQ
ncbi:unnamed protein product [Cylindrotheca closterium]|uniref:Uncharacterized protein n=1 Tax=Cylindrotheca closterium TaxID=2856 RepID=A0AAD2FEQ3_9STRA|nr:unnamed protein product [Cylindrotheca closterium]CAJ1940166.1 unnamed protein product [Cylindrotheca closterium]